MAATDNKRIAKNTLFLYVRMFLVLAVSLYTFRLLLQTLGELDYGIYNVVGGVVVMFSFMNTALTQSTQRYLSYHLGLKDSAMVARVFSTAMNVHIVMAAIIILLAETLGLWFLNRYMNFPPGTLFAANVVYQVSILTFVIQLLVVPYQASIISYERMSFYAYLSILEVALKLLSVVALLFFSSNRLIIYSIAVSLSALIVFFTYKIFCNRRFTTTRYEFIIDRKLFRELSAFSGWNMLGGLGNVAANQGVNIIFNMFCGVVVNAAMGVSNQVCSAVTQFVSNMQAAFNPQIIKSYAAGARDEFMSLVIRSTRLSFLLIFMLGLPIVLYTPEIFDLWLAQTPEYAPAFTRLILIFCMFDAVSGPLWTSAQASGKVKIYMIVISLLIISNVPATLLLLWAGYSPVAALGYKVATGAAIYVFRIFYLGKYIAFPIGEYCRQAVGPVVAYIAACLIPCLALRAVVVGTWVAIAALCLSVLVCGAVGFFVLLTASERQFIVEKLRSILKIG